MPIVADASAAVRADLRPFEKDLKKLDTPVQKLGARIKTSLSPANLVGGLAGGFAAAKVLDFFVDAGNAAGEFQDTVSATGVIFDADLTPALERWAESAHSLFGASEQDALAAANQFAVFGKSAGLAGQELVDFSTEMVQLGGDLASFFGGSTEEAITAVGAALRGESEPIRRYGVLLDDATLRQRAFELGLISTTKNALTPQQRVLAAQAEILAQTSDAQGDFVRTSDGLMNTQRDLTAQWENMQIEIGEKLIPVMLTLSNWAIEDGIPALRSFFDAIEKGVDVIDFFAGKVGEVTGAAEEMTGLDFDVTKLINPVTFGIEKMGELLEMFTEESEDAATSMTDTWAEAWGALPQEAKTAYGQHSSVLPDAVQDTVDDATGVVEEGVEVIAGKFGEIPETGADAMLEEQWRLKDATTQLVEFMEQAISPMKEKAELQGFLASRQLARGLASNNPLIRQKAIEMRDAAVARLNEIDGFAAGVKLAKTFANGIDGGAWNALQAAARLAAGVAGFLPSSEPKNPKSALRGITGVGGGIVDMIADGIRGRLGSAQSAAALLSGALVPNLGIPSMAMAGAGTTASLPAGVLASGGDTTNVYLPGRERRMTAADFAADLRRLEYGEQIKVKRSLPDD